MISSSIGLRLPFGLRVSEDLFGALDPDARVVGMGRMTLGHSLDAAQLGHHFRIIRLHVLMRR